VPRKKREDTPQHDEGPFVIRGHLILGAVKTVKFRREGSIRDEFREERATICSFEPKVNPNWEKNIEFVCEAMNRAAGHGRRRVEEPELDIDDDEEPEDDSE